MTDDEFRAWLARDNEVRCVLVEMDYVAEVAGAPVVETLYLSDREFHDDVTDHPYIDCVKSAPQYSRGLSGDRLSNYSSAVSALELDNADGQLDFMLNLACDGSLIRFAYGGQNWPVADFKQIFSAIVSKVTAPAFDRISVALRDTGLLLNQSIGGTSTVGGTGPNADRSRPANNGYIHNMQPLVLDETIDGGRYVHSDGSAATVAVEVRDRGVSVGFNDNADGATFDLDAPPTQGGPITCDVLAEPLGSDKVRVSDQFDHFIGDRAGLTARSLYDGAGPTFTVDDDDDYMLGISLPEAKNALALITEICDSGNCFPAVKRDGKFTFGRLRLNDIASLGLDPITIREDDIDQGSFSIEHAPMGYHQFQAFMSRNWHQQREFATSLSPDEQAIYSRAGLYLLQPDSIGTTYANAPELYHKTLAKSPVIDTLLSQVFSEFDTDALAQWMTTRRAMQLPWIEIQSKRVGIDFYQLELGDPVLWISPRFGAAEGVLFQVIGIVIRLTDAKIELRLARRNVIQEVPSSWTRLISALDETQQPYEIRKATIAPLDMSPPVGGGGGGARIGFGGGDGGVSIGLAASRPRLPTGTFDKIKIVPEFAGGETSLMLAQMRFGTSTPGGTGDYTSLATFLSDGNGATLQDFSGVAPSGGQVSLPSYAPTWTAALDSGSIALCDSAYPAVDAAFCFLQYSAARTLTMTFGTPIRSWGALFSSFSGVSAFTMEFYLGATLVQSYSFGLVPNEYPTFDTFFGFAQ